MVYAIVMILVAYVSGSLPFGYWVAKIAKGIDIREHGSKSTGATNVFRCVGKKEGVLVFVADMLKGTIPVLIARKLESMGLFAGTPLEYPGVVPVVVAFTAIIGHSKSLFLNFQGGKSAATGLGTLFALNPLGALLVLITFLTGCFVTRIVSVSSVLATFLSIVYFTVLGSPKVFVGYCVAGFLYVAYRHKANFQRLLKGTEPRIGEKPKPPDDPAGTLDASAEQRREEREGATKE